MKKYIRALSLILALILCLSMAACSSDDKAFEEADALLAAGDYDGAIAAFSAIGRYEEISAKIAEAEKLRNEANAGFLFGNWVDINTGYVFTFKDDDTGLISYPEEMNLTYTPFSYVYSDGMVKMTAPGVWDMPVCEIASVTHIICEGNDWDLVPEADYPALAPYEVEITLDNWQEYFELREADSVGFNAFGEPEYRSTGYGFFLKDEYVQKLPEKYGESVEVSLEVQYDKTWFTISGDFISGDYELTPSAPPRWYSAPETGLTEVVSVYDQRYYKEEYKNDFSETVSASLTFGYQTTLDDVLYYFGITNLEIIRISGTLTLKR